MDGERELFPHERITPDEWVWVQGLIQDVQQQEMRDTFARSLFEWDLAVRQFRKVELKRIVLGAPNEEDWLRHATCLHALLAIGNALLLESKKFSDDALATFHIFRNQIIAYVAEVEQSYREWHHGVSGAELKEAQKAIFGVAP